MSTCYSDCGANPVALGRDDVSRVTVSGAFLANLAVIIAASVLGAMLFFSTTVAPLVFMRLPADLAGRFIRALFPHYYLNLGLASIVALGVAWLSGSWSGLHLALLGVVALGFVLARVWLLPRINSLRDRSLHGDSGAARRFKTWHLASVLLNGAQMLALGFVCFAALAQ